MLARLRKAEDEKGFTLIEFFIVIAIIGILAAIAIPQFGAYKERTYHSDTKEALHNLYIACKAYWIDKGADAACAPADVENTTYNFSKPEEVTITTGAGTEAAYTATAKNSNSPAAVYKIDSSGTISKQ